MSTSVLNLDVEALRMLTGFCHWIPAVNGRQAQFVQERYPGWEWNQIIPALIKKRVLVINAKVPKYQLLSQGLYIAPEIESLTLWIRNGRTCFKLNKFHEMES